MDSCEGGCRISTEPYSNTQNWLIS